MQSRLLKFVAFALTGWLLIACQPLPPAIPSAQAEPQSVATEPAGASAASEAAQAKVEIPSQSVVTTTVDLSTVSDPAQRKAEEEFLAVALAKEQAFYKGDAEGLLSYYADNVVSILPEAEEVVGKSVLAEGVKAYLADNRIVGLATIKRIWVDGDRATRQAQWEEWVTPKNGGPGEHHIGRCTLNWEKIDGEWKVVSEFANFLVPPAPFQ